MDQQTLLHQHSNLKFVQENTRRTPDLPTIEMYKPEGHNGDMLVLLACVFALGVVLGMFL
jgi:hypothetical protein